MPWANLENGQMLLLTRITESAVLNKRILKILKHFSYAATEEASVSLYRKGVGDILSVESLLKDHFGENATLPEVLWKNHKIEEVAPEILSD